ncbi:hypothetical protein HanLR1_Chr03g0108751 [Helianthus annuus]|nr:hypothetical protein HanLR1_Chr03g0108751 [Helianthus annuus]
MRTEPFCFVEKGLVKTQNSCFLYLFLNHRSLNLSFKVKLGLLIFTYLHDFLNDHQQVFTCFIV